jgi:hypothetical protein
MLGEHSGYREGRKQIDNAELARTHRKQFKGRDKKWIPSWALDDRKVRRVVYDATWNYAKQRAADATSVKPGMSLRTLENLAKNNRKCWQDIIERSGSTKYQSNIKEHLRTTERGYAARLTTILYMAYRLRLKGPDIAEELEMDARAVRMVLYRMNNIARKLFEKEAQFKRHWSERGGVSKSKRYESEKRLIQNGATVEARSIYKEIALFYFSGVTLAELSRAYGIKAGTIHAALKRYKLLKRGRPANRGCFVKDYYRTKGTDFDARPR